VEEGNKDSQGSSPSLFDFALLENYYRVVMSGEFEKNRKELDLAAASEGYKKDRTNPELLTEFMRVFWRDAGRRIGKYFEVEKFSGTKEQLTNEIDKGHRVAIFKPVGITLSDLERISEPFKVCVLTQPKVKDSVVDIVNNSGWLWIEKGSDVEHNVFSTVSLERRRGQSLTTYLIGSEVNNLLNGRHYDVGHLRNERGGKNSTVQCSTILFGSTWNGEPIGISGKPMLIKKGIQERDDSESIKGVVVKRIINGIRTEEEVTAGSGEELKVTPLDMDRVKEIMGERNFFGPEEYKKYFDNTSFSNAQLPQIPWTEDFLRLATRSDNHLLFYCPEQFGGSEINFIQLFEFFNQKNLGPKIITERNFETCSFNRKNLSGEIRPESNFELFDQKNPGSKIIPEQSDDKRWFEFFSRRIDGGRWYLVQNGLLYDRFIFDGSLPNPRKAEVIGYGEKIISNILYYLLNGKYLDTREIEMTPSWRLPQPDDDDWAHEFEENPYRYRNMLFLKFIENTIHLEIRRVQELR
jgi:hypothetical protein